MSIGQIEGRVPINHEFVCELGDEIDQNGDPPRIWLQKKFEPGCAFSRSLGDKIAETVGCVATPEIMAHELSDDDVVCIIASDGVWEFLTNQNVVDICLATLDPCCHTADSFEINLSTVIAGIPRVIKLSQLHTKNGMSKKSE